MISESSSQNAPRRPNRIGNWLVLAVVATIMSACGEVFELAPAGESEGPPPDFIATTSPDNIQEFVNPDSNQEGSGQVTPVTDNASQGQQETLPPQGGVEKEPSVAPANPVVVPVGSPSVDTSAVPDRTPEPESTPEPEPEPTPEPEPEPTPEPEPEPTPEPEPEPTPEPEPAPEPEQSRVEVSDAGSLAQALSLGQLKAFPGAEGFGTDTVGGRGGQLCKVTNLNESGDGSLRHCVEMSGPRMVIFEVGGTITLTQELRITEPFISIYGQTAPGDGIMVRATVDSTITPLRVSTHDVVIQHMRFRAGGSNRTSGNRDAASISNRVSGSVYNVVLDHISFSWGIDEIMDIWYDPHDLTISNSIFSEGLWDAGSSESGPAGRGLIVGSEGAHSISLHHLFFAHSYQRNPLVKISGIADVVNLLVYHWISWGSAVTSDFDVGRANFVKNKYIAKTGHPDSTQNSSLGWGDFILSNSKHGLDIYFEDNIGHNRPTNDLPQWQIANTFYKTPYDPNKGHHTNTRHPAPPITEIPVDQLEEELVKDVGATLPRRDSTDLRLIEELRTRTGILPNCVEQADRPGEARCAVNVGGWPTYENGPTPVDSDDDGIPDSAETRLGFDPSVNDAMQDRNDDGFLNIEEWIHSIGQ